MGKKKSKNTDKKPKKSDEYRETNEYHDGLEMDGADKFEAMQDENIKMKMDKIKSRHRFKDTSGGYEELYALSGDSDSDDEDLPEGVEFDDDDDEQNYEEEDDGDVRAWGNKKKHFYGGNPNDPKNQSETVDENELIEAEAEEAEGKLLQKKQLDKLDDEDFFDMFTPDVVDKAKPEEVSDKVQFDITQLTEKERKALFKKESPEFQGILQDFETKMAEVIESLEPFRKLIDDGRIPAKGPVVEYVNIKYKLTLTYCVNILTYVMFKTKSVNLKLHPLTKRIVEFKQMLEEMVELDEKMQPKMKDIIKNLEKAPEVKPVKKKSNKKKLKILDKVKKQSEKEPDNKNDSGSKNEDFTTDERIALEIYEAMRSKKEKQNNEDLEEENEDIPEPMDEDNGADADDEELEERRAITYQIAKNKGLQPKRNKLQRNPRVKHRKKFEKAKVRRKGQVREVRKETKRYGGEVSGINMRVKKGIKLS